jgi:hypothetical protein
MNFSSSSLAASIFASFFGVAAHGFGAARRTTAPMVPIARKCGGTDLPKILYAAPIVSCCLLLSKGKMKRARNDTAKPELVKYKPGM